MIKSKIKICEVCKRNESVGVFAVPGVPLSVAYCKSCVKANSHPMWALIANTACCGGLTHCADWWKEIVISSLSAQGKTIEWFNNEVVESIKHFKLEESK